jgi:hypothetical protein
LPAGGRPGPLRPRRPEPSNRRGGMTTPNWSSTRSQAPSATALNALATGRLVSAWCLKRRRGVRRGRPRRWTEGQSAAVWHWGQCAVHYAVVRVAVQQAGGMTDLVDGCVAEVTTNRCAPPRVAPRLRRARVVQIVEPDPHPTDIRQRDDVGTEMREPQIERSTRRDRHVTRAPVPIRHVERRLQRRRRRHGPVVRRIVVQRAVVGRCRRDAWPKSQGARDEQGGSMVPVHFASGRAPLGGHRRDGRRDARPSVFEADDSGPAPQPGKLRVARVLPRCGDAAPSRGGAASAKSGKVRSAPLVADSIAPGDGLGPWRPRHRPPTTFLRRGSAAPGARFVARRTRAAQP